MMVPATIKFSAGQVKVMLVDHLRQSFGIETTTDKIHIGIDAGQGMAQPHLAYVEVKYEKDLVAGDVISGKPIISGKPVISPDDVLRNGDNLKVGGMG